jgi:hypothetical protein
VYRVYYLSIDNIFVWICGCRMLYNGDCLGLTICACYFVEKALHFVLDATFDNF